MRGCLRRIRTTILIGWLLKKILWHTLDELRKVQRREEKSEEINNELELNKEKIEWDNLIILKDKVKELNEIEKLVFFEHLLAQKEITNLVEVARCLRRTLQRVKKNLLVKLKNTLKN